MKIETKLGQLFNITDTVTHGRNRNEKCEIKRKSKQLFSYRLWQNEVYEIILKHSESFLIENVRVCLSRSCFVSTMASCGLER